ncbi:SGNH/GDSL hydrolase family protein [Sphingomonas segetis]|jgi:hypothetical protein|uniref:SGNH/GDSL hydrolase family protein n=1 Tax=Sphingomonas segetis TaxID=1104779 RepID=UPI0012D2B47D|nr:SGNH/GDSL hydrolase family protein [Sphingomonas segetis]
MANYQKITEIWPEVADFLENQRKIGLRGDVLTYWPNTRCDSFSTDSAGYRHSTFAGKTYSVSDCLRSERYGISLGSSIMFGFGIAGNENSGPSIGAERLGFPFANASMPGASSRNLHSLLTGLLSGARRKPQVVVFSNDGDLGGFCTSSMADPIFGSPNISQQRTVQKDGDSADADKNFPSLLSFTSLWTAAIARLCRANGIPLVLLHQSSFFEKADPTATELGCGLGEVFYPWQETQFANHRKFNKPFFAHREALAKALSIPLAGTTEDVTFIDEFHADKDGTRQVTEAVADRIEAMIERQPAEHTASESAAATPA